MDLLQLPDGSIFVWDALVLEIVEIGRILGCREARHSYCKIGEEGKHVPLKQKDIVLLVNEKLLNKRENNSALINHPLNRLRNATDGSPFLSTGLFLTGGTYGTSISDRPYSASYLDATSSLSSAPDGPGYYMGKLLEWTGTRFLAVLERWAIASRVMQHLYLLRRMVARVDADPSDREAAIFRILDEGLEMARPVYSSTVNGYAIKLFYGCFEYLEKTLVKHTPEFFEKIYPAMATLSVFTYLSSRDSVDGRTIILELLEVVVDRPVRFQDTKEKGFVQAIIMSWAVSPTNGKNAFSFDFRSKIDSADCCHDSNNENDKVFFEVREPRLVHIKRDKLSSGPSHPYPPNHAGEYDFIAKFPWLACILHGCDPILLQRDIESLYFTTHPKFHDCKCLAACVSAWRSVACMGAHWKNGRGMNNSKWYQIETFARHSIISLDAIFSSEGKTKKGWKNLDAANKRAVKSIVDILTWSLTLFRDRPAKMEEAALWDILQNLSEIEVPGLSLLAQRWIERRGRKPFSGGIFATIETRIVVDTFSESSRCCSRAGLAPR